jgi:hypothetical protein
MTIDLTGIRLEYTFDSEPDVLFNSIFLCPAEFSLLVPLQINKTKKMLAD